MKEIDWINDFKDKRSAYGVSQNRLALIAGMSREHISRIENGKIKLTSEIKEQLTVALEKCNPDNPLEMLFDYVRIRFPTMDVQHVVEEILQLKLSYFLHEVTIFFIQSS